MWKFSDRYQNYKYPVNTTVKDLLVKGTATFEKNINLDGNITTSNIKINQSILDSQNSKGYYGQVLSTNSQNKNVWSYQGSNYRGIDFIPSNYLDLSSIPIPERFTDFAFNWHGAVLSQQGMIYFIPRHSNVILKLNPYTKQTFEIPLPSKYTTPGQSNYSFDTVNGIPYISGKWFGGSTSYNGKLYFSPANVDEILVIDTLNNDRISEIDISETISGSATSWSSSIGPNGNIYLIPNSFNKIIKINTINDTYTLIDILGLSLHQTANCVGGVLAPNGKIYCIPSGSQNYFIVIDTLNDSAEIIENNDLSGNNYLSGTLSKEGKIYFTPRNNTDNIAILDPSDHSINITDISGVPTKNAGAFEGATLGMDGYIYMFPHLQTVILKINTTNNTFTTISFPGTFGNRKCSGSILGPNGVIYGVPTNHNTIPFLKTELPTQQPWMLAPEFNKF